MDALREYMRTVEARDDELRRGLRALGALLLGVGVLVLAYRRSSFDDPWGDFAMFLLAFVPAVFLYGAGFLAASSSGERRPWHGVFLIFGLVFATFALFQFLELVDGDPSASLNVAWIFAVIAVLGALAALVAGVRFGLLAAGVAFAISWLALWNEILGDDFSTDAGTLRGFTMLAAAILVGAGIALYRQRGGHADLRAVDAERVALPLELLTAGGLVFLFGAGFLSLTGAIVSYFVTALSPLGAVDVAGAFARPSVFWDLVLLVGSVGLVAVGTRLAARGPAYLGALGLAVFVFLVGLDLDDSSPSGSVMGWPLLLLLAAGAALAASVVLRPRTARTGSSESP